MTGTGGRHKIKGWSKKDQRHTSSMKLLKNVFNKLKSTGLDLPSIKGNGAHSVILAV